MDTVFVIDTLLRADTVSIVDSIEVTLRDTVQVAFPGNPWQPFLPFLYVLLGAIVGVCVPEFFSWIKRRQSRWRIARTLHMTLVAHQTGVEYFLDTEFAVEKDHVRVQVRNPNVGWLSDDALSRYLIDLVDFPSVSAYLAVCCKLAQKYSRDIDLVFDLYVREEWDRLRNVLPPIKRAMTEWNKDLIIKLRALGKFIDTKGRIAFDFQESDFSNTVQKDLRAE